VTFEELERAILLATELTKQDTVYVVGSQAILATFPDTELPPIVTMSAEVDIRPAVDDAAGSLATLLDAWLGEWSELHIEEGFYVQGVDVRTANLPSGWEERVIPIHPTENPKVVGLCLELHDLCASKILANREKDLVFVSALLEAKLASAVTLQARINDLDPAGVSGDKIPVAQGWAAWAVRKFG
jgi:hypothetical protein